MGHIHTWTIIIIQCGFDLQWETSSFLYASVTAIFRNGKNNRHNRLHWHENLMNKLLVAPFPIMLQNNRLQNEEHNVLMLELLVWKCQVKTSNFYYACKSNLYHKKYVIFCLLCAQYYLLADTYLFTTQIGVNMLFHPDKKVRYGS